MNICTTEAPEEYEFEPGHTAACWQYHPESGYADIDFSREGE